MDLRQLEYIIAIAEEGNITRAAGKMFISQPALSQLLKRLENSLGSKLFVRDGKSVRPTTAGKIYLNGARAILNIEKAMERKLKEPETSND